VSAEVVVAVGPRAKAVGELQAPSVVGAMLFIGVLKAALKVVGFELTWRWIRRCAERTPLRNDVNSVAVARAEYRVAMAAALYPGRALCLERSLVLYYYLRRRGVPVDFCMGVQMYPFGAHAWVEFRKRVVNDVAEHVKQFRPIVEIAS
jgi:hypothetical protein